MSNELIPFAFEGKEVRTVLLDAEPRWVGKDVCEVLGHSNPNKAMKDHCKGVTKRYPIVDSLGRTQEVRIIAEPDVLRLIVSSKLPAAERFERWVFEEVLPSIRKTGAYAVAGPNIPTRLESIERKVDGMATSYKTLLTENQHLRHENVLYRENERLRTALERKGSPLTEMERDTILALAKADKTPAVIARAMNRSEAAVRRCIAGGRQ